MDFTYEELNNDEEKRRQYIMNNIQSKLDWLKLNTNHKVFMVIVRGSTNYGLDIYSEEYMSDIDVVALIIPSLDNILKGSKMVSHTYVMDDNSHIDVKDIRLMKEMWIKSNPSYLELLSSKFFLAGSSRYDDDIKELHEHADDIEKINFDRFLSATKGMIMEKRKALCHPYPTIKEKIDKYGWDGKQLSHMLRLYYILEDILVNDKKYGESIIVDDIFRKRLLNQIKLNQAPFNEDDAVKMADDIVDKSGELVEQYRIKNGKKELNKETEKWIDDFIIKVVKQEVIDSLK